MNEHLQRLRGVLQRFWGYEDFLPLQEEAMTAALKGRDSLVVLPTGGGKSLCYQAPAMCLEGTAVVVSPLISLMKDQVDSACACGVPAAYLNSTQSLDERRNVREQLRRGQVKLLYVAPERLITDDGLRELSDVKISLFAIDEAHCVSTWGHDFRPHYRRLAVLRKLFPEVGLHAFTATATERVRDDIVAQLKLRDPAVLVGSFDRPNLTYRVERKSDLTGQLTDVLERHREESGIVYCITRKEVEEKAGLLQLMGYKAAPYHAGLDDETRRKHQEAFINEEVQVIVATVAFGMGIDKSNVRFVVHAGMPPSVENYQQESGRAGRDNLEAECCLFYGGDDVRKWEYILGKQPDEVRRASLKSLRTMANFCEGAVCRHRALVQHFGQDLDADCGCACDICLGEREEVDGALTVAQKILSSVFRQEQRFGADYTALVLKGSREQRIAENGHDKLSTWGLLKDETKQQLLDWIGQLVQQEFLRKEGEYNVLKITAEGGRVLKGELTPRLLRRAETRTGEPPKKQLDPHSWEGVDRGLFEKLRALRAELAKARSVPPYVIFGDAPLRDMARRRPSDRESFLKVYGVGTRKADDFAERFLAEIGAYCREHQLSQNVEPVLKGLSGGGDALLGARVRKQSAGRSLSTLKAFQLFAEGHSTAYVAQQMDRAVSTVRKYLAEYLITEKVTDPTPWVAPEVAAKVEAAIVELGPGPYKPIFEKLSGEVDYDSIRTVSLCWRNRHPESDE